MSAQVARVVAINDGLYAALAANWSAENAARVDAWHANALYWQELADKAAREGGDTLATWVRLGRDLASNAQEIADLIHDDTAGAKIEAFLRGFPSALGTVVGAAAEGAGDAVSRVAKPAGDAAASVAWAAAKPLLIVGGVVALVAFLLTRSGVGLRAGPLRLG